MTEITSGTWSGRSAT